MVHVQWDTQTANIWSPGEALHIKTKFVFFFLFFKNCFTFSQRSASLLLFFNYWKSEGCDKRLTNIDSDSLAIQYLQKPKNAIIPTMYLFGILLHMFIHVYPRLSSNSCSSSAGSKRVRLGRAPNPWSWSPILVFL